MCMILLLTALLLMTPAFAKPPPAPKNATNFAAKPLVTAHEHMIVAAHPLAAQAGDRMMAGGGSAADAVIAALLVLNVVEPQSSGIGGGGFALVHGPDGLTTWDAREIAPAGATPDLFMENGEPLPFRAAVESGRSIGVPGLVRLMEALHARHGKLPWSDLFQPAIRVARDGFEVSPRLANALARYVGHLNGTDDAAVFLPGGEPMAAGALLKQPRLAETFATIAAHGGNAFYTGPWLNESSRRHAASPVRVRSACTISPPTWSLNVLRSVIVTGAIVSAVWDRLPRGPPRPAKS